MKRLWLYVLIAGGVLGCLGLVIAWVRVWLAGGVGLAPVVSQDDVVYHQLMASGQWCMQNLTSTLADGGCRVWPLWLVGGWFNFGFSGLGEVVLRVLLLLGLGVVLAAGTRRWARQAGLNLTATRTWLTLLLVLTPLPLILVTSYVLATPELTLMGSLIYAPSNLLSWLFYVLVVGGFFLYRDQPRTWPLWGGLAGLWGLHHAYYIPFVLSLFGLWLIVRARQTWRQLGWAASLVTPAAVVAGYYWWLSQANQFFAFHLHSNQTRHFPYLRWWLLLGIAALGLLWWYARRQARPQDGGRVDPFLKLWLLVAVAWQLVPLTIERRFMLVLSLPIAILFTHQLVTSPAVRRRLRLPLVLLMAVNGLLLAGLVSMGVSTWVSASSQKFVITAADRAFGEKVAQRGPQHSYIGDQAAVSWFFPLGKLRIVNAHQHLSPDYAFWNRQLRQLSRSETSCSAFSRAIYQKSVSAVILLRKNSQMTRQQLLDCGWQEAQTDDRWSLLVPSRLDF